MALLPVCVGEEAGRLAGLLAEWALLNCLMTSFDESAQFGLETVLSELG